jgi:hypothetical protein
MVKLLENPGPGNPPVPPTPVPGDVPPIPPGVKQISDAVLAFMPVLEQITGTNRKELTGQFIKFGLKGGSLDTLLNGFFGTQQKVQEAKIVRILKTSAIWIPVGLLLTGLVLITLIFYTKLLIILMGGL